jgi:hypothetical protein
MTAVVLCTAAGGLFISPPGFQAVIRAAIVDLVVSGQGYAQDASRSISARLRSIRPADVVAAYGALDSAPDDRFAALAAAHRRLLVENARLRDELKLAEKYGVSPVPVSRSPGGDAPQAVLAALIGASTNAKTSDRSAHLGKGRAHGIAPSSVVVEDLRPLLDRGDDAGFEPELDVFVGRCMVGRIAAVGKWTSTLELITDARYRALAQIVRPSEQGASFGAEGILTGQGTPLCKLTDVPTTQTVTLGDEVYTSDRDRRTSALLYYGRVVRVEEAGRNWDITVEPAVKFVDLKTVAVLKLPPALGRPLAE